MRDATERPLLFADLETTGHDPLRRVGEHIEPWHEIIDIGALLVEQRTLRVIGEFERKIRARHPERCLPNLVNNYYARALIGEWDKAVSLEDAITDFLVFAGRMGVPSFSGGENFFFDWGFLLVAFASCGVSEADWKGSLHYKRFDTGSMAIQEFRRPGQVVAPEEFSLRNGSLVKKLDLEPEPKVHAAINGARKAFEVYKKLMYKKLEKALKNASGKDTCWPGCAKDWSLENPAWGHCVMYMLYANEFFGGDIIFVEAVLPSGAVIPHYFNCLSGEDMDFSGSQFEKGTEFRGRKIVTREYVLSLPDNEAGRYEIFKQRVSSIL